MDEAPQRTGSRSRGRGRGRRGGGRGRGRGSRGTGDRQQQPAEPERRTQGRDFREARPPRGRGLASRPPEQQVEEDVETKDECIQLNEFSRRQIVSNWDRYKTEEKEGDDVEETLRGADFNVLLSFAGESFAQFRFAEEKEWELEVSTSKQVSPLFIDCHSLAQSLQELPLHLRLNLEPELVQVNPPAELPQIRLKRVDEEHSKFGQFRVPTPASSTNVDTIPVNCTPDPLTQVADSINPAPALQEPADHLDEELEFLLQLETPVNKNDISLKGAKNVEVLHDPETVNNLTDSCGAEVIDNTNSQPRVTTKKDTEEELEDWLDSMIS
ncbi:cell death regulator Aven [Hemitrygon akajei]|uniref:cell death regulator Aven n=1 Tax=Hemitrygon akajei TaxID=2704970 RepID=UPI003BF97C1B